MYYSVILPSSMMKMRIRQVRPIMSCRERSAAANTCNISSEKTAKRMLRWVTGIPNFSKFFLACWINSQSWSRVGNGTGEVLPCTCRWAEAKVKTWSGCWAILGSRLWRMRLWRCLRFGRAFSAGSMGSAACRVWWDGLVSRLVTRHPVKTHKQILFQRIAKCLDLFRSKKEHLFISSKI